MNLKLAIAATLLIGSLLGGLIAGSPAGLNEEAPPAGWMQVAMLQCAGGFHPDRRGNCQPENGLVDSRCPDGFEAAPFPSGSSYRCVPVPAGY